MMRRCLFLLLVLAVGPSAAAAQTTVPNPEPAAAAARRDGDIRLDGRVDEPAWRHATPITRFVQGEPVEGAAAEQRTEVRVLYDADALYVGVIMYDTEPERIASQLVRRDSRGQYDWFELSLDPNNDRRTGYRFRVGASGVRRDVYLYDDNREDDAWDAVWASAVHRGDFGWSIEMRIPLSQLRYETSDAAQTWGVNFSRRRIATNELTYFALESKLRHGKVSLFGQLAGLVLPRRARRIELRPYALATARAAPSEAADPFFDGSEMGSSVGLDLRYGLGASYTLDVTVNPDFGQVEVDPAVINLTAFETFFPEKRPFFVEDAQIFDFSLSGRRNQLFYSRRIGREPRGDAPDGSDFIDIPTQTTILGAAKLTGRSAGGLSLGVLTAVTARESGRAFLAADGRTVAFEAEPRTEYGVIRVLQDFRDGASQLGVIATAMRRELPNDGGFDFLPSNAYAIGIDFEHNWGGPRSRDWAFHGFAAGTLVRGVPEALIGIQQASNHYFQRPDATRFSVDTTANSLSGINWRVQFERRSAQHWTGAVWLAEVTPGFEVNDVGFSTSGERLDGGARISYQEITPGRLLRSYRISAFTFHNFRHEALDDVFSWSSWRRAHKRGGLFLSADLQLLNYWQVELNARLVPSLMSDVATRGGPLMVEPASIQFRFEVNSDRRRSVRVDLRSEYVDRGRGGWRWHNELEMGVRPIPSVELQVKPQFTRETNAAQYVTTTGDMGFTPTFGRRYLFADLERRSASLETRIGVALSPDLTFQLYAQPLLSSGAYPAYKQLARSESFDFDIFDRGQAVAAPNGDVSCVGGRICRRDETEFVDLDGDGTVDFSFSDQRFNIRSLRLSAVLRWEYRPGSQLFLVWQQSRRDRATIGSFDLARDFDALFDAPSENVFTVKLSYWFGL
ncbi:MAG: carbohydrate binding family 9 domain-containing protein [Gemmatimonadetes bacterium]|nr:carbohydrate binding family 9 domain-containing protein [Gemmatimonadota bacterium]